MRVFLLSIALAICCSHYNAAQLDQVLKKAGENLEHRDTSGLSNDKIIAGLKQALQVSTAKAVALTGRPNGFLKNEAIKIALPPKLESKRTRRTPSKSKAAAENPYSRESAAKPSSSLASTVSIPRSCNS